MAKKKKWMKTGHGFNTPSGGVSAAGRERAKNAGETMPGTGGKFPIRNKSDLEKAKHDIGRTNEPRSKVVAWIDRRAHELGGKPVGGEKKRKGLYSEDSRRKMKD